MKFTWKAAVAVDLFWATWIFLFLCVFFISGFHPYIFWADPVIRFGAPLDPSSRSPRTEAPKPCRPGRRSCRADDRCCGKPVMGGDHPYTSTGAPLHGYLCLPYDQGFYEGAPVGFPKIWPFFFETWMFLGWSSQFTGSKWLVVPWLMVSKSP